MTSKRVLVKIYLANSVPVPYNGTVMAHNGPHPLSWHIGMVSHSLPDDEHKYAALTEMVRGIQKYQNIQYDENCTRSQNEHVIWQDGQSRLLQIGDIKRRAERSILLIPSLVNGYEILNLCEQRSFALWLESQGLQVFILDWGDLCQDKELSLEQCILERLIPAFEFLYARQGQKIDVLGYCMGGIFALALAQLQEALLRSLVLLATPWDFDTKKYSLSKKVKAFAPSMLPEIEEKKRLQASLLHILFTSIDPEMTQKKFANFSRMKSGSVDEKIFCAVEGWLNGGTDIPYKIAYECIQNWFCDNQLVKGQWKINGQTISLCKNHVKSLVISSSIDRLVSSSSSEPLVYEMKDVKHHKPNCGHVGMMAGNKAMSEVWHPIKKWIFEH